jgi:hypothetical protein
MAADPENLLPMVHANDKLLKALVTLLAVKDEHLLSELHIVFGAATQTGSRIGKADRATWAHIRQELAMISDLVDDMEEAEAAEISRDAVPELH